jgi:hypothetical protein
MAIDIRNLPAFLADDATFRAWGSGIAAQIAAMGLVQTSDTGQINWVTVARPALNTIAGYEIWRFNDALQATKPVFIRIDYGTSSPVAAQDERRRQHRRWHRHLDSFAKHIGLSSDSVLGHDSGNLFRTACRAVGDYGWGR